jgi:hypothetical protein
MRRVRRESDSEEPQPTPGLSGGVITPSGPVAVGALDSPTGSSRGDRHGGRATPKKVKCGDQADRASGGDRMRDGAADGEGEENVSRL